jgi:hypothetical protein
MAANYNGQPNHGQAVAKREKRREPRNDARTPTHGAQLYLEL